MAESTRAACSSGEPDAESSTGVTPAAASKDDVEIVAAELVRAEEPAALPAGCVGAVAGEPTTGCVGAAAGEPTMAPEVGANAASTVTVEEVGGVDPGARAGSTSGEVAWNPGGASSSRRAGADRCSCTSRPGRAQRVASRWPEVPGKKETPSR